MTDILERLRGYNPIDRTSDNIKAAQDIADAADEITALREALHAAGDGDTWREACKRVEGELSQEKQQRMHWQGLAYLGMRVIDKVLANRINLGEGTTEESMEVNARMAMDKYTFLFNENTELSTLRGLLREAVEAADVRGDDLRGGEWWGNKIDDSWFVRVEEYLEGKQHGN